MPEEKAREFLNAVARVMKRFGVDHIEPMMTSSTIVLYNKEGTAMASFDSLTKEGDVEGLCHQ